MTFKKRTLNLESAIQEATAHSDLGVIQKLERLNRLKDENWTSIWQYACRKNQNIEVMRFSWERSSALKRVDNFDIVSNSFTYVARKDKGHLVLPFFYDISPHRLTDGNFYKALLEAAHYGQVENINKLREHHPSLQRAFPEMLRWAATPQSSSLPRLNVLRYLAEENPEPGLGFEHVWRQTLAMLQSPGRQEIEAVLNHAKLKLQAQSFATTKGTSLGVSKPKTRL